MGIIFEWKCIKILNYAYTKNYLNFFGLHKIKLAEDIDRAILTSQHTVNKDKMKNI